MGSVSSGRRSGVGFCGAGRAGFRAARRENLSAAVDIRGRFGSSRFQRLRAQAIQHSEGCFFGAGDAVAGGADAGRAAGIAGAGSN